MSDFLEEVAVRTRQRVDAQKEKAPLAELKKRFDSKGPIRSLSQALRKPGAVSVIAELKQASPSAGIIRAEDNIPKRIEGYAKGGAAALSILTEEYYFHGSPHLLEEARSLCSAPLLRKDFIIDPYQIIESRSLGADAILLIVALLPGKKLKDFMDQTEAVGLEALVEVHDEAELAQAIEAGAKIVGINNRNLHTLRVDVQTSGRLLSRMPREGRRIVVIESGIREPVELSKYREWGANAVLIGETLMRNPDAEAAVRSFVEAGQAGNR